MRVGDAGAVFGDTFVSTLVRLQTLSDLQRSCTMYDTYIHVHIEQNRCSVNRENKL